MTEAINLNLRTGDGTQSAAGPLLAVDNVTVTYGNITALRRVRLFAAEGQVTAIVGDNGAGKSTLIRSILGLVRPAAGQVRIDGQPVTAAGPSTRRAPGVECVFQNLALIDDLSVAQNIFLNRELCYGPAALGWQKRKQMAAASSTALNTLTTACIDPFRTVRRLSGGQRQSVAIARAVKWGTHLVLMDEPTAALGVKEREEVETLIEQLRDEGRSFLLISHDFRQVMRLADVIWVMRQGEVVARRDAAHTSGDELVALITGARPGDAHHH